MQRREIARIWRRDLSVSLMFTKDAAEDAKSCAAVAAIRAEGVVSLEARLLAGERLDLPLSVLVRADLVGETIADMARRPSATAKEKGAR